MVRRSMPVAGGWATRFGNWLGSIGWGKFFLLAVLLMGLAGIVSSLLPRKPSPARPKVDVVVSVDNNGLHVTAPKQAAKPGVVPPAVSVDDKGVRIQANKDGRKVTVVIDDHGVRVEEPKPVPPAEEDKEPQAVIVAPEVLADPDRVAEAVDAAHDKIEEIVQGQVDRKVAQLRHDDMLVSHESVDLPEAALVLLFIFAIVKIALGSKRRAESRAQVASAVAADEGLKRQLAEAQLKTMQAQVEPHFLFNTLASVDYLIETDPARASRMQKNLIQYLRSALPQMRQGSSTLGQETALCRSYLEILKMRMDERLQFTISMPAGLSSASFPPMMLQTLVENSIKHGLEPKPDGGTLTLSAAVVDGCVRVAVSDTGLGFGVAGASGGGVGLNNVRERLQALFGSRARLVIEPNSPTGTIATIEVPYTVGAIGAASGGAPVAAVPAPPAAASPA